MASNFISAISISNAADCMRKRGLASSQPSFAEGPVMQLPDSPPFFLFPHHHPPCCQPPHFLCGRRTTRKYFGVLPPQQQLAEKNTFQLFRKHDGTSIESPLVAFFNAGKDAEQRPHLLTHLLVPCSIIWRRLRVQMTSSPFLELPRLELEE